MNAENRPETEEELISFLKNLSYRHILNNFNLDRSMAELVHVLAMKHTEFLISELLQITEADYTNEKEKISSFFEALNTLSASSDLRIKFTHKARNRIN